MIHHPPAFDDPASARVFAAATRRAFAIAYPETPLRLDHALPDHPLLSLEALAMLGEALPAASVEYNRGDIPIGAAGKPVRTGLGIGDTIRAIHSCNSWAVLKNVEQISAYANLLADLLGELKPAIEARTGPMLKTQAYVFVSSPNAITPYHFDPEHNILLQVTGSKVMTVFPAGDPRFAPDRVHETYHAGGPRELPWDDGLACGGTAFPLNTGQALYVPVMAPHFVRNGPAPSVSLSITWRSAWSFEEADARAFNGLLRRAGFDPSAPARWPSRNRVKATGWRMVRRLPGMR